MGGTEGESAVLKIFAENFRLSFAEGLGIQNLVQGKKATIQKLQKLDVGKMTQEQVMQYSNDMDLGLMPDDGGAIIIMDDKDLATFVNVLNEDYMESPITGERYEIIKKRPLKVKDEDQIPEV